MKIKEFDKIILVSLCDEFSKELGMIISDKLEMIFCDAKELIEYELIDKNASSHLCSLEYLKLCETRALRHIASYQNMVVAMPYEYLIRELSRFREKGLIVFLKLPKTFVKNQSNMQNAIAYDDRSEDMIECADVIVNLKKLDMDFVSEKVLKEIGGLL